MVFPLHTHGFSKRRGFCPDQKEALGDGARYHETYYAYQHEYHHYPQHQHVIQSVYRIHLYHTLAAVASRIYVFWAPQLRIYYPRFVGIGTRPVHIGTHRAGHPWERYQVYIAQETIFSCAERPLFRYPK